MSKVKKENDSIQNNKAIPNLDEQFAFRSVILSAVLSGVFLITSVLFNGDIIKISMGDNILINFFNISFKVILILLFFVFMMISIGNYKELTGKPLDFKIVIILFIISLIQGFRSPLVLFFSFIGLICILIYLYLVQES
jgi:hypothetical protein